MHSTYTTSMLRVDPHMDRFVTVPLYNKDRTTAGDLPVGCLWSENRKTGEEIYVEQPKGEDAPATLEIKMATMERRVDGKIEPYFFANVDTTATSETWFQFHLRVFGYGLDMGEPVKLFEQRGLWLPPPNPAERPDLVLKPPTFMGCLGRARARALKPAFVHAELEVQEISHVHMDAAIWDELVELYDPQRSIRMANLTG